MIDILFDKKRTRNSIVGVRKAGDVPTDMRSTLHSFVQPTSNHTFMITFFLVGFCLYICPFRSVRSFCDVVFNRNLASEMKATIT